MKLSVLAVVGLLMVTVQANAATIPITPNNAVPVTIEPGNIYKGVGILSYLQEDYFNFFLPVAPLGTITATVSFASGEFVVAWFKGAINLTGDVTATEASPLYWILDPAGNYSLRVKNLAEVLDGYVLSIATTPLPPALVLFGTALAGLTWLGRRRRPAKLAF